MYSEKDILARLQRGEKADDIAKEMTAQLNAALDQKRKEDKAKEAEREKAALSTANHHLAVAATALNEYIGVMHPDAKAHGIKVTPTDIKEVIETVIKADNVIDKYTWSMFGDLLDGQKYLSNKNRTVDPLAKFLKDYKLS